MADRGKIIEGLKDAIKRADYDGGIVRMSVEVCQIIIDVLEDRGWISVKDRLPDAAGVEVLVLAHNNYYDTYVIFIAFLAYGEIKWCTYDTTKMTLERPTDNTVNERLTITHWMPLPEPPKEDE